MQDKVKTLEHTSTDEAAARLALAKPHITSLVGGHAPLPRDTLVRNFALHAALPAALIAAAPSHFLQVLQHGGGIHSRSD